jgi:hypothetical protein
MVEDIPRNNPSQQVFVKGWGNRQRNLGEYIENFANGGEVKGFDKGGEVSKSPWEKAGIKPFSDSGVAFRSKDPYTAEQARKDLLELPGRIISPFTRWAAEREAAKNKTLEIARQSKGNQSTEKQYEEQGIDRSVPVSQEPFESNFPLTKDSPVKQSAPAAPKIVAAPQTQGIASLMGPPKELMGEEPTQTKVSESNKEPSFRDYMMQEIMGGFKNREEGAKQDRLLSLLSAGLGIMGGTSPYAGVNIGQGAQQGIAAHMMARRNQQAEKNALMSAGIGLENQRTKEAYYNAMSEQQKLNAIAQAQNQKDLLRYRYDELGATKEERDRNYTLESKRIDAYISNLMGEQTQKTATAKSQEIGRARDDLRETEKNYERKLKDKYIDKNPMWHMNPQLKSEYDKELRSLYDSPAYLDLRKQAYPNVDFSTPQIKTDNVMRFDNKGNPIK